MKYYLHDTNAFSDEKVTLLFIEYGYEGVGLFYVILEKLASQEKPISEKVLKTQLKIGKRLQKQLSFMYKIGILSVKDGDVFSENILKFSEKYQIKKEKTRERVSQWRDKQKDTKNVTRYKHVRNTDKVKLSKVNENNIYIGFDFFKDDFKKIWLDEFIPLKKKKKASVTDRALKSQMNKIKKLSLNNYDIALQILEKSINSGWSDFYELNNKKQKKQNPFA